MHNKKAVSEMISYVILISIAIGMSLLVYGFLKLYVPKDKIECQEGIALSIESVSCQANEITLSLSNRGKFSVDAFYLKIGAPGKDVRTWINNPDSSSSGGEKTKPGYFYFPVGGLKPGSSNAEVKYTIPSGDPKVGTGPDYVLEIQPAVFSVRNKLAACSNGIILQDINCPT